MLRLLTLSCLHACRIAAQDGELRCHLWAPEGKPGCRWGAHALPWGWRDPHPRDVPGPPSWSVTRQPQPLVLAALRPKWLGQASSYGAELVGIPHPHIWPPRLPEQGPALPGSPHRRQDLGLPGKGWGLWRELFSFHQLGAGKGKTALKKRRSKKCCCLLIQAWAPRASLVAPRGAGSPQTPMRAHRWRFAPPRCCKIPRFFNAAKLSPAPRRSAGSRGAPSPARAGRRWEPAMLELLPESQPAPPGAGLPRGPPSPASTGCRLARNQHLEGISAANHCGERGGL